MSIANHVAGVSKAELDSSEDGPNEAEQQQLIESLIHFVDRDVAELEQRYADVLEDPFKTFDQDGRLSRTALTALQETRLSSSRNGFFGLTIPTGLGGTGVGPLLQYRLWETLYQRYGAGRLLPPEVLSHFATGANLCYKHATTRVLQEIVPLLISGERTSCFALSEPNAGSDIWSIKTRAIRVSGGWRITGTKQWITNGPYADFALVFAVTDPDLIKERRGGISCFVVETDREGFAVDRVIRLYGQPGGHEGILSLVDVVVPEDAVVGDVDNGHRIAMAGISVGRLYNCARAVGLGLWALSVATQYARQRHTFGLPIAQYQGVQWLLADSAIELYAAQTMSIDCARRLETGASARRELSMAKTFATEAGFRALDRCMQVLGGMGLTNEVRMFDAWHQIRMIRIAEGSSEILRRDIARSLLEGS